MAPDKPAAADALPHMETPWFRALHEGSYLFYHMAFTLGLSLRVQGGRNVPSAGPALIVANHQSFLDPLLIGVAARRPLVYLARKTLFRNRFFARVISTMNAVPIDQEGVGKEGIRVILEQLQLGKPVVVFPEGSRTPDGAMYPLKAGIHLIIKRARVPVIPVGIAGAYHAWPIWRPYPVPAPLFLPAGPACTGVSVGAPLDAHRYADLPREQALQELFEHIRAEQVRAEKLRRR